MLTVAPRPLGADRVGFTLHKFLADVGTERDTYIATADGGTEVKAVFSYRDRSTTVPLAARYAFAADGSLEEYEAWGSTSRFTGIDERVDAPTGRSTSGTQGRRRTLRARRAWRWHCRGTRRSSDKI